MIKRLFTGKNVSRERLMSLDHNVDEEELVDLAQRHRLKPEVVENKNHKRKRKVGKMDTAIFPIPVDSENVPPNFHMAEQKDNPSFSMETIFRAESKYGKFFENPLKKKKTIDDGETQSDQTDGVRVKSKRRRVLSDKAESKTSTVDNDDVIKSKRLTSLEVEHKSEIVKENSPISNEDSKVDGIDKRFQSYRPSANQVSFGVPIFEDSAGSKETSVDDLKKSRANFIMTPVAKRKNGSTIDYVEATFTYRPLNSDEKEELFSKVRHNRIAKVEQVLSSGVDPDTRDEHGNTMLHVAAQNNLRKMAALLTGYGANIAIKNKKGFTALDFALTYKFTKMSEFLVNEGG